MKPIFSNENDFSYVPEKWQTIPAGVRQKKACQCAYTALKLLAKVHGHSEEEWLNIYHSLIEKENFVEKLFGKALNENHILALLNKLKIMHELIPRDQSILDARLSANDAVLLLFEQYSCGYIQSTVQKIRTCIGSRSEHTVIIVGKYSGKYLLYDVGWVRNGWQWMEEEVLLKALSFSTTTLITTASADVKPECHKTQDGTIHVNGFNGRWSFTSDGKFSAEEERYLYENDNIIVPFATGWEIAPREFIVNVTNRCHMGCRYCYVDCKATGEDMTPECFYSVVKKAYQLSKEESFELVLHGGEPLLVLERLSPVIENLRKENIDFSLSLQTSGDGLDEKMLEIIRKHQIKVGLSLDGPEHIHNAQRSNFLMAMNALEKLRKEPLFSGVITTLTNHSCLHIKEILQFFADNNISRIAFGPAVPAGRMLRHEDLTPAPEILAEAYITAWKELLRHRKNGLNLEIREFSQMLVHLTTNLRPVICGMSPCAACSNLLGIDVSGKAYVCDMLIGDPDFEIGDMTDLNADVIKSRFPHSPFATYAPDKNDPCCNCCWRKVCMAGCPSNEYFLRKAGKSRQFCTATKRLLTQMAFDIINDDTAEKYLQHVALNKLRADDILEKAND